MVLKFVVHSHRVLRIARRYGWLPGARYTNLRDVRKCDRVGFLDIEWRNYSFERRLSLVVFIYDDSASVQEHDITRRALLEIPGMVDVVIVSRPSQLSQRQPVSGSRKKKVR